MDIAPNHSVIHNWREDGHHDCCLEQIVVGAATPRSRTGAIPPDLTVMTWTGPVALHENAEEKARSEVAMAWRILSHLAGIEERELPDHMSKTRPKKGNFNRNTLLPGRLLDDHYRCSTEDWSLADSGITDLWSIATDALLAAASRAHLPSSGMLYFRQPDVRPFRTSLPRLSMEIAIDQGDLCAAVRNPSSEAPAFVLVRAE
jgi:hypothetical protein